MEEAVLLGVAQDAGVPQVGCGCDQCRRAKDNVQYRIWVASLGILDHSSCQFWMVDATPNFREQLHKIQNIFPGYDFAGIFITHAHIGHYTGLIHLGKEAWNTRNIPVYATLSMGDFLKKNAPWSQLVTDKNISIHPLVPSQEVKISKSIKITPIEVPHRGEFSDTLAFVIGGSKRKIFYCPDIDSWDLWEHDVVDFIAGMDIALVDGTFFSLTELSKRNIHDIPHPFVEETVKRLFGVKCEKYFVHLNHTNPLLDESSKEKKWVENSGFKIGRFGERWQLGRDG